MSSAFRSPKSELVPNSQRTQRDVLTQLLRNPTFYVPWICRYPLPRMDESLPFLWSIHWKSEPHQHSVLIWALTRQFPKASRDVPIPSLAQPRTWLVMREWRNDRHADTSTRKIRLGGPYALMETYQQPRNDRMTINLQGSEVSVTAICHIICLPWWSCKSE